MTRKFLFLQGPASPFLRHLAKALEAKSAEVQKISVCLGDLVFWWPRSSSLFKGEMIDWPVYLDCHIRDHGITDLVMLGDGRPLHAKAAEIGIASGVRVHILEHGYLRPDWLTIEPDGMSGHSRFPKDRVQIEALARGLPSPAWHQRFPSSFLTYALYDLAFHIPNVLLGWLVHPHYRQHGPVHPVIEYSGWVWKALTAAKRKRHSDRITETCASSDSRFFLFPLQLSGDYQILRHAPGGDLFKLVTAVISSFAHNSPQGDKLLFKVHPIDNGLSGWQERIEQISKENGVADRVFLIDGGDTDKLIEKSIGVVTVNSTVGLTAIEAGKPVIALGSAVYDIDGLTFQSTLAEFWKKPIEPDSILFDQFKRALIGTTQVRGGFIGLRALEAGVKNVAERLMETDERLPISLRRQRGENSFRYESELFPKS